MPPPNFTRPLFRVESRPLPVTVAGVALDANPTEMKTGSLGYRGQCRAKLMIGGCLVDVQVSAVVTVIGSKGVL